MAWEIVDRFPVWGETGEFPVDGFFYEGGDQVNEKHLDALWNGLKELENDTRSALEDIDSDGNGVVDEADYANDADASTYKGNDIDSNNDGKVDAADDADTVGGEPPSNFADTNHGNEEHSTSFTTLTEVNNNADVPNADYADNAGDADTVSGEPPSNFADTNHGNEEHSTSFTTLTEVNNNADVPNADYADNAGNANNADKLEGEPASNFLSSSTEITRNDTYSFSSVDKSESETVSTTLYSGSAELIEYVDIFCSVTHDSNDDFDSASTTVDVIANYADNSSSTVYSVTAYRGGNSGTATNSNGGHIANGSFNFDAKQVTGLELQATYSISNSNLSNTMDSDHEVDVTLGFL